MGCSFPIIFRLKDGREIKAKCRNCANCRMERKSNVDWSFNLELMENYKKGYGATFLTLTYDENHVPITAKQTEYKGVKLNTTLKKQDALDFKNRLRKLAAKSRKKGAELNDKFAYIIAGEYGDEGRPHYHMVIIGMTAGQTATLAEKIWNKGMMKIETLKGTAGIRYCTDYFSQAINGPQRKEIFEKYGFEAPFLTKSKQAGEKYVLEHLDEFKENGLTYISRGKTIPLPRALRERLATLEGIKYEPSLKKLQKTILEAENRGFNNAMDYQKWQNWIKEYNNVQRSRMKGNGEKSTYTLFNAMDNEYHIQGEDEL